MFNYNFRLGEWLVFKSDGSARCENKKYCKRFDNWHWWSPHQRCYRQFSQGPCKKGKILNKKHIKHFKQIYLYSIGTIHKRRFLKRGFTRKSLKAGVKKQNQRQRIL